MDETLKVNGLRETQRKLYSYSQRLGDFVVLKSLRAGANVVKQGAQRNAPFKSGKLKRGFRVVRSKIHRGRTSTDSIGVYLTIATKKKDDPYYGRFQEDGWNTRGKDNDERRNHRVKYLFTRRSISSSRVTQPGKTNVPGRKFIDQAFIQKRAEATRMIVATATAAADLLAIKTGL